MPASLPSHSHVLVYPLAPLAPADALAFVQPPSPLAAAPPPALSDPLHVPWRIDNKYYTADVSFRILAQHSSAAGDPLASLTEGDEPAVVVLTDAQATPPSALTALLARLSSRDPEIEVALLVSQSGPSESGPSSASTLTGDALDEEAWDDAALDAGFEWVHLPHPPAPASSTSATTAYAQSRELAQREDEDEPLRRIVGALQAHMWEGMQRAETGPARGRARAHSGESASAERASRCSGEGDGCAGKAGATGRSDSDHADDVGDDESSVLGAPPLPSPRRRPSDADGDKWTFPSRFLPSIARDEGGALVGEASFEDDFAPFVEAGPAHGDFPAFTACEISADSTASATAGGFPDLVDRRRDLPFSNSDDPPRTSASFVSPARTTVPTAPISAEDLDDLDELFARLSAAKSATVGMGLDERRDFAERMVRELLGGAGLSEDEDEAVS
ncbi:hypothetical protein Rhopal_003488-T1 [Rhodotorula paludigena]|uniref:Uncharacterized protein n=1 Tax=Rhodotorula paludigena TaxID=86838 RepID=A0AAV5GM81_9BASI|nr:hypothetical protein Rhopal_003488-T1 [Rhodotorula paludigena]